MVVVSSGSGYTGSDSNNNNLQIDEHVLVPSQIKGCVPAHLPVRKAVGKLSLNYVLTREKS